MAEPTARPWRTGPENYADIYDAAGNLVALVPKGCDWTSIVVEEIVSAVNAAPHAEALAQAVLEDHATLKYHELELAGPCALCGLASAYLRAAKGA